MKDPRLIITQELFTTVAMNSSKRTGMRTYLQSRTA